MSREGKTITQWMPVKADGILFLAIAVLFFGSVFWTVRYGAAAGTADGACVRVCCGDARDAVYPLDVPREITLACGNGTNVLRIENGSASVIAADCPDQYCVRHKLIRKEGESIICLPHRLVITVEGGDAREIDDVTN